MDDNLYIIDLSTLEEHTDQFRTFFTEFTQNYAVAIVTDATASSIPDEWITSARYAFCSDGHELYVSGRLRYKNVLTYTREVSAWIASTELPCVYFLHKLFIEADPYTSASLVREFNELFTEFRAYSCKKGLYITDCSNPRKHIAALISSNYKVTFVSPAALLGGCNFELASAVTQQGFVYKFSNCEDLQQLFNSLVQK